MAQHANAGTQRPIDLRSDTVTRPSPEMLQAMMSADVGDDVWGDDPTVNKLQEVAAAMFGKEAALFCPSGTMTNQIAIKVHTRPGDELLCADSAHVYVYEGGGIAFNSGVQAKLLPSNRGRITAAQIEAAINPDDSHWPATTLVCLENTANKGGGSFYTLEEMQAVRQVCTKHGLKLHLDGARVFNAFVAAGYSAKDVGPLFDTISICLSKGLGCPVGSLLLGSKQTIKQAHRVRKVLGGGMRQVGFLAAAGLYALEHNIGRLADDHRRALRLAEAAAKLPFVEKVLPVDTNIVLMQLKPGLHAPTVVQQLASHGVLTCEMSNTTVRFTTHLDVTDEMVERACELLAGVAAG